MLRLIDPDDRSDLQKVDVSFPGLAEGILAEMMAIRRLSGKSRVEMTNGRLTTMVSADASFLVSRLHFGPIWAHTEHGPCVF